MKLFKLGLFVTLFAAVCLPAAAQTELHLTIPFNFVAGGKILSAGYYKVVPVFQDANTSWSIVGRNGSVMVLTDPVQSAGAAHNPSLIFSRAGGQLSLTQIWSSNYSGREVMRSNVKRTLLAKGGQYVEIKAE